MTPSTQSQIGTRIDHLRLKPQPKFNAELGQMIAQWMQALGPDVLVHNTLIMSPRRPRNTNT